MNTTTSDDPLSGIHAQNRDAIYRKLREEKPVYWSTVHAGWVLTRYDDVQWVLKHPDAMALEVMPFLEKLSRRGGLDLPNLLAFCAALSLLTRPPRHEAVRKMLGQALGGIARLDLPGLVSRRAEALLDDGHRRGSIDLAEGYGRALALFVIGTFLGIPDDDLMTLSALAREFMAVFERTVPSVRTMQKLDRCAAALTGYFLPLLAARRRNPGADGLSSIVRFADEQFPRADEELAQNCLFFFIAAEETTSAAIATGAWVLLQRPGWRAHLAADPSRHKDAALELLRLASPIQFVARQLGADVELAGQKIRAGEPLMLMLGAANRDPEAFPDPDEPVLDRQGPKPLVFAAGPYSCVGAQLAALEVEIAMRALLNRPALQLSSNVPIWSDRMNIAPLLRLEAQFT
jgi:cytochrome P450